MKTKQFTSSLILALFSALFAQLPIAHAQGTAFTYQGQLANNGSPANGTYDLSFTLFTTNSSGVAIAGPVTNSAIAVSNGLFTVTIDFGLGACTGGSNWMEIAVSTNEANSFTTLAPRQQLTPVPYAITAGSITGPVPLTQLPTNLVTNGSKSVNVSGIFNGSLYGSATAASLATNVVSGISITNAFITNAFITNSVFAGNGSGLVNLPAQLINWEQITNAPATNQILNGGGDLSVLLGHNPSFIYGGIEPEFTVVDSTWKQPSVVLGWDDLNAGTGWAGQFAIAGAPQRDTPMRNIAGIHIENANLSGFGDGTDVRAFCFRIKDPAPAGVAEVPDTSTDYGSYGLFEGRYLNGAPDQDTTYCNFFMWDNNGNVGIGDLGERSDDHGNGDLHPSAKTTLYGSRTASYPMLDLVQNYSYTNNIVLRVTASGNLNMCGVLIASNGLSTYTGGITNYSNQPFVGNGAGLTNLNAKQLTGTFPLAELPSAVVTNTETGVTLSGTFNGSYTGDGSGLSNLNADTVVGGLTTNLVVSVPTGTATLCFSNGILRAIR